MEFIDSIVKTLSEVSQTTIKKGKDVKNIAKLNLMISDEERKIERNYIEIGRLFYEMHRDDCEKEFAELIISIDESKDKIKECNEEIKELKGIIKCPGCDAEIMGNLAYCPHCGYKIEQEEPEEKECQEETSETIFCNNCGAKLDPEYKFCVKCGTAVANEEPVVMNPDGSAAPSEETDEAEKKDECCHSYAEEQCSQDNADDDKSICDVPSQGADTEEQLENHYDRMKDEQNQRSISQ